LPSSSIPESVQRDTKAPTVALLLSGGVDSSVALNLLVRQGYNVTAFYLKIWLEDELAHLGTCPWEDDYATCKAVVEQVYNTTNVTVPLQAISLQEEYQQRVISYTIKEAAQGRTPNPDILCNSRIKFGCFYDTIDATDAFDYVATGHYAQLTTDETTGVRRLQRAPDAVKDQTYFLCALTQDQLRHVLFPIGHLEKHQVRQLAEDFKLPNRDRPDSQGLCFLGKVKFEDFLRVHLGERPGPIIDAATGDSLGQHKGVWYHTVGQRKGIGHVLDPKATARGPWYVVAKDPLNDIVYCSNEYDQEIFDAPRSQVTIENLKWIPGDPALVSNVANAEDTHSLENQSCSIHVDMKIRHGPKLVSGLVTWHTDNPSVAEVKLDQKDGGLAPGQFVVIYHGKECLGGGVISERHWAKFLSASKTRNSNFASVLKSN
jgi:tRNA-specific 2-thiouridylase